MNYQGILTSETRYRWATRERMGWASPVEMREAERRQITVLFGKLGQAINDSCELVNNESKSLADED